MSKRQTEQGGAPCAKQQRRTEQREVENLPGRPLKKSGWRILRVSYLAGELAKTLQRNQENLHITDEDILCVQIAGLCHDLGHGPFSHLFDESFLPRVKPEYAEKANLKSISDHQPSDASATELTFCKKDVFEVLNEELEVRDAERKIGSVPVSKLKVTASSDHHPSDGSVSELHFSANDEFIASKEEQAQDYMLVKDSSKKVGFVPVFKLKLKATEDHKTNELSVGTNDKLFVKKNSLVHNYIKVKTTNGSSGFAPLSMLKKIWPYEGRTKEKSFLYEIVANKRNGIDVDKWDYFARDSLYLGVSCSFDWRRCMMFARVLEKDEEKQICTRDKEVTNLYSMFHTRYTLHQRAYQHKVSKILESMIVDALVNANNFLTFPDENGKAIKMSESIDNMAVYAKLTDNVIWKILEVPDGKDPDIDKAKKLIQRILVRDLYRPAGHVQLVPPVFDIKAETARKEIGRLLREKTKRKLSEDDISIHIAAFNYGMRGQDPMKNVLFYNKTDTEKYVERSELLYENSMDLPIRFEEKHLRVCSKDGKDEGCVKNAFQKWCAAKNLKYKPEPLFTGMSTMKSDDA
ncbi:Deoxynucleoside triphosphate triphosphohydrolase SAMHD1 [Holothuria leucospilota]|uniref:Deoxynucleoside triphosphate triphosphohydrolase SAMHD1 n=1 Tax=Holothuria leucospilota TaxID=206669 RepID=A0A9Q0YEK0_HOLLE|nr:Deoxynucleoside triphosphate triphosphohydrolase SAMHD1 [Holothuria leucospilota]